MRYMSVEGRDLMQRLKLKSHEWFDLESALLRHTPATILSNCAPRPGCLKVKKMLDLPPTRSDALCILLRVEWEKYEYICDQYVTHDLNRFDAMKAAVICSQYDFAVLKRLGDKCKGFGHFSIPYLATCLENESGSVIEALRRESRLDELVSQSPPVELPPKRFPGQLRAVMHENEINAEIERIHKGH